MDTRSATIGPYETTHVLGQGGMGIVFAGRHRQTGAQAAIKTCTSADASIISQLRREIHTLARISHPGVVPIFDHGVAADGKPWYAMELIEGRTLSDMLDGYWRRARGTKEVGSTLPETRVTDFGQTVSPDHGGGHVELVDGTGSGSASGSPRVATGGHLAEALQLIRGLCDLLAFVHGEGVIHGDIKPDNIFIRANGLPVLVDFGLAAEVGGTTGREVMDVMGRVAGSLPYMSPEQLRGELLDARTDIYSLGCVLYEAVTGRPPHIGGFERVLHGDWQEAILPPSELVDGVSDQLNSLIMATLAESRDDRIGYAVDMATALASIDGRPTAWAVELPDCQPYLYRPPFVGRKEVFQSIECRLKGLFSGQGGLLFVGGESGVGKTRLVLEAATRSRRSGLRVVTGQCAAVSVAVGERMVQNAPLHPLTPLFEAVADRCVEGGPVEQKRLLGEGAALLSMYFPGLARLSGVAELPEPAPLPATAARGRLFRQLAKTLELFVGERPLLVVLDDLQWSDELTLGFLEHASTLRLDQLPLLILGTYRDDECGPQLETLVSTKSATSLSLGRMEDEEVGQMVSGMLALAAPPRAFVSFLATESEGNPFFVAEYLRTALAEGVVVRDRRGRWAFAETTLPTLEVCENLPLPGSLRQVIDLRLGRLRPATKTVLDTAAIMGRLFDVGVLQVALKLDDMQMLSALEEMVMRHVIEPHQGGYRFVHDKLREIPDAELPEGRRRSLHQRVAAAMEEVYGAGDSAKTHAAAIGHHWAAAAEAARAVPHLVSAGDHARSYNAVSEAIGLYEAGRRELETAGEGPDLRATALMLDEKLGDLLTFAGQHDKSRDAFERALSATPAHEVELRARMRRKVGKTWEIEHNHEKALAAYSEVEEIMDDAPEESNEELEQEWIQIVLGRAWIFYWLKRLEDMNREINIVRPHVENHRVPLLRYQFHLAIVTRDYIQDRYRISEETLTHGRACVAAAQEARSPAEVAFGRFVLGFGLLFNGQLEAAEGEIYTALQASRSLGDPVGETRAAAYLALVHRRAGRIEETRKAADETFEIARDQKMAEYISLAQALQGWVAFKEGDRAKAAFLSSTALERMEGLTFLFPFHWTATLTLIEVQLDEAPLAEMVERAKALRVRSQMHLPDSIDAALAEAIIAYDADDEDAAQMSLDRAVVAAEEQGYL